MKLLLWHALWFLPRVLLFLTCFLIYCWDTQYLIVAQYPCAVFGLWVTIWMKFPKKGTCYMYIHINLCFSAIFSVSGIFQLFPCVRGTVHVQIHNWRSVYLLELMSKKRKEGQFFFSSPSPALQTHLHFHLFSGAPAFQFPGLSGVLRCQLDPVSLHFTLLIYSLSSDGPLPCHFLTVHPVRNLHPSSFQPQSLNLSKPKSVLNLSKL